MNTKEFLSRSNIRGFIAFFSDLVIIFCIILIGLQFDNFLIYLATVWLIGIKQFSIGEALLHEAVHKHLFKNSEVIAKVASCVDFCGDPSRNVSI